MKQLFHITFITPCFCTGANQLEAEIRPASIRGCLRWWFRCVGGSAAQESIVFGSAAGTGSASALLLRVCNVIRSSKDYAPTYKRLADPGAYLNYFLGAKTNERPSRLWENEPDEAVDRCGKSRQTAFYPQDSSFELELCWLRMCGADIKQLFDTALDAFLRFGSLGYRKSRGFGAWCCAERIEGLEDTKRTFAQLQQYGFSSEWTNVGGNDFLPALNQIEQKLKANKDLGTGLRYTHPARAKTALGYSLGPGQRQASAVYFRPVGYQTRAGAKLLVLLTFQAPDSILGPDVIKPNAIINPGHRLST